MSSTTVAEAPRRRAGSLAARLTAWYALLTFVLILVVTGYLYRTLENHLDEVAVQFVTDELQIIRALLREGPGNSAAIIQEVEIESESRQYGRFYTRILDASGNVVTESPGFPTGFPPAAFPEPVGIPDDPGLRAVPRSDRVFRISSARASAGDGESDVRVIQMVLDWTRAEAVMDGFRRRVIPLLGISLVLCLLVGYYIARQGIRPLKRIAEAAAQIGPKNLHERIGVEGAPGEVLVLARRFDDMLDRLEESFGRLERFSSDIAHELRTPLGNLRGEIEVALSQPRDADEYRDTLESSLEEAVRLCRLVDQLLFLARSEHPESAVQRDAVDLHRELTAIADYYEAAASESGVSIEVSVPAGLEIDVNRELFQRSISNLLDNALAFTPSGGTIALRASREDTAICIEIEDTGCGIGTTHVPRVFDRLYQVDSSRRRQGMGLGLTIVDTVTRLHGGEASIVSAEGQGTRVRLDFPAGDRSGT